jgi:UDP-GlcNAc:undecaprenyl-phosphate GlcNAc-1-phosphate transferase
VHMIREGQLSVALLPLALLGATLGFLPYNFNPAKIFMGSSGSYFLGWALAALGIMGGAKVATVLLAMGLPIMDVAWLIYHRWKRGDKPESIGRDHLHHRLLDIGFTQRQIVLAYYAWCIIFGTAALVLENRLYKLIAMIVLFGVALIVLYWASKQPAGRFHNGKPNETA